VVVGIVDRLDIEEAQDDEGPAPKAGRRQRRSSPP